VRLGKRWAGTSGGVFLAGLVALVLLQTGCDDKIEKTVGDATAASVEQQYRVTPDPLLSRWVSSVGHTLCGYALRQDVPFEFKVLDADLVNAFAAPYGHVYITTGLLGFAESEDEVWAILGHEIGHVTKRHGMSDLKRSLMLNLGASLVAGSNETLGAVAGAGVGLLSMHYSRDQEYEADDVGRRLTFASGHDPRGNVDFFLRLMSTYEKEKPSQIELMFATHPPSKNRADRQRSMPELSDANAEALLQTGRGYLRRFQLRRAGEFLGQAAELRPRDASVLVSLAEVELRRGQYPAAETHYAAANSASPSRFAARGLALASAGPTTALAALSADDRHRGEALALSLRARSQARVASLETAATAAAALAGRYAPQSRTAQEAMAALLSLADLDPPTSDAAQGLLAQASSTISRALDPVYAVEAQRKALGDTSETLRAVEATLGARLDEVDRGALSAADLAVLQRIGTESQLARVDLHAALARLDDARGAISASVEAAQDATVWVDRLMKGDTGDTSLDRATEAVRVAEERALPALAATREAGAYADSAALRALVVRISAAGLGRSPEARQVLDGLVGHYVLASPTTVRSLRESGAGYGEAAVVLATCVGAQREPAQMLRQGMEGGSTVDEVAASGAQTEGAMVLLRYLARAAEYETAS
jgi:beta-barrel assembly-enhancing protease